jgi:hypothetical protein
MKSHKPYLNSNEHAVTEKHYRLDPNKLALEEIFVMIKAGAPTTIDSYHNLGDQYHQGGTFTN